MFYILSFIFGASVGSFVQVIATRLNVAPIIKGRSKCLSCGEALRVSDLVPVLSFIFLRGKCRYCKTPYGKEALLIESLFGCIFVFLYHSVLMPSTTLVESSLWLLFYTVLFAVLGVMALYDRAHSYIPINFLSLFLALSFVLYVRRFYLNGVSLEEALAPLIVASPFLLIWLVTRGRGLGFGDVLLFLGVGAFFGLYQGIAVFILSVWAGAISGLYQKYKTSNDKKETKAIPFVPYIVFAFIFVLFTGIDIFSIAFIFG